MPVESRRNHSQLMASGIRVKDMSFNNNNNNNNNNNKVSFYGNGTRTDGTRGGGGTGVGRMNGGNSMSVNLGGRGGGATYPYQGTSSDGFQRFPGSANPNMQMNSKPSNPPLKMLVPSDMVGAIIGRGGATIRDITKSSRARVDVHRNYEGEGGRGANQPPRNANGILSGLGGNSELSEKVISIYGKEGESITAACKKILEVMDGELKKIRQNRMECGVRGFMNGIIGVGPQGGETVLKLLAHNSLIGRIIGKQGRVVNEIKEKSGAKITVSNVYDINANNLERTVILSGSLDAISSAEARISEILRLCHQQESMKYPQNPDPNTSQFRNGPRGNLDSNRDGRFQDNYSSPYSNYEAAMAGSHGRGGQSHLVGQPAMVGAGLMDMPPSSSFGQGSPMLPHHHTQMPPPNFGPSYPPSDAQHPLTHNQVNEPSLETLFLYVPATSVGAIIGKKGESIRQITRSSNATIKIAAEKEKEKEETELGSAGEAEPTPPRSSAMTPGEKSVAISATFDSQCHAIAQIFKKLFEERFFGNDPPFLSLDYIIQSKNMGKVLGKQKIKIRTIEQRTGVIIRVPDNRNQDETSEGGKEVKDEAMSYVTIRGTLHQMIQAMTMIREILYGESGIGFPYPAFQFPPFSRNLLGPYHNPRGGRGRGRF